jgi:hypothetical protein
MSASGRHGPSSNETETTADEDPFFRAVLRTAQRLGPWPMAALFRLLPHVAKLKEFPMSTSRYCSPTSRGTEPATRFGPVPRRCISRLHRR